MGKPDPDLTFFRAYLWSESKNGSLKSNFILNKKWKCSQFGFKMTNFYLNSKTSPVCGDKLGEIFTNPHVLFCLPFWIYGYFNYLPVLTITQWNETSWPITILHKHTRAWLLVSLGVWAWAMSGCSREEGLVGESLLPRRRRQEKGGGREERAVTV